jgi:ribosomal protein S19E (S16A)
VKKLSAKQGSALGGLARSRRGEATLGAGRGNVVFCSEIRLCTLPTMMTLERMGLVERNEYGCLVITDEGRELASERYRQFIERNFGG